MGPRVYGFRVSRFRARVSGSYFRSGSAGAFVLVSLASKLRSWFLSVGPITPQTPD